MDGSRNFKPGDKVIVFISHRDEDVGSRRRKWMEQKRCRVLEIHKHFITVVDKKGIRECFSWQQAGQIIKKEE